MFPLNWLPWWRKSPACSKTLATDQVSERTLHTSAALLGEGRQMLQEHEHAQPGESRRPEGSGGAHQQHMSTAGLVRRKGDAAEGVQMATIGSGGASPVRVASAAKDE